MASKPRSKVRWTIAIITIGFFAVLMADAFGLFKTTPYTALPHGGHSHYVPDDRDPGVDASQCPTRAPGPDELISPQCQMIRMVRQGGAVYYVPESAAQGWPPDRFPTTRPGSGEVIQPDGRVMRVAVQEG